MILEAKFGASDFPLKNHYLIENTITMKKIAVRDGINFFLPNIEHKRIVLTRRCLSTHLTKSVKKNNKTKQKK